MSANDAALRLDDLCKSYGRIRAVDHLSLEVHAGEMAGFLGPNGAGKSTTLYMTTRLVHPSGGKIEIFGHNVWKNFKRAIQYVGTMLETPSFYEFLSARKNLELMSRLRGNADGKEIGIKVYVDLKQQHRGGDQQNTGYGAEGGIQVLHHIVHPALEVAGHHTQGDGDGQHDQGGEGA